MLQWLRGLFGRRRYYNPHPGVEWGLYWACKEQWEIFKAHHPRYETEHVNMWDDMAEENARAPVIPDTEEWTHLRPGGLTPEEIARARDVKPGA